jgi:hypothetical protein
LQSLTTMIMMILTKNLEFLFATEKRPHDEQVLKLSLSRLVLKKLVGPRKLLATFVTGLQIYLNELVHIVNVWVIALSGCGY